jgi:hypothetical protein
VGYNEYLLRSLIVVYIMIQSKLEARAKEFMQPGSLEDHRLKREEASVKLRKQNRFEHVAKRRARLVEREEEEENAEEMIEDWEEHVGMSLEEVLLQAEPRLRDTSLPSHQRLNLLLSLFTSASSDLLFSATSTLKKLLGCSNNPPITQVARPEVISKLISLLDGDDRNVIYEALWCLTNLGYGPSEVICQMMDKGVLPPLCRLINHTDVLVSDSALWVLSNLATEETARKRIVESGVIDLCLEIFHSEAPQRKHDYSNLLHLISNLILGSDYPPESHIYTQVLTFVPWAFAQERESIIAKACWICCYIADSTDANKLELIIQLGLLPKLMELLLAPSPSIVVPAVRTIGNIAGGNDVQTQAILDLDLLSRLHALLDHSERQVRKDAMWCLSNITAGTIDQTMSVIQHPIMAIALEKMNDIDLEIRREATWAVVNAIGILPFCMILQLSYTRVIDSLYRSLDYNDAIMLKITLEGLMDLLSKEKEAGETAMLSRFEELGGLTALNSLMMHPNAFVYKLVSELNRRFFDSEEVSRPSLDSSPPVSHYEFS